MCRWGVCSQAARHVPLTEVMDILQRFFFVVFASFLGAGCHPHYGFSRIGLVAASLQPRLRVHERIGVDERTSKITGP